MDQFRLKETLQVSPPSKRRRYHNSPSSSSSSSSAKCSEMHEQQITRVTRPVPQSLPAHDHGNHKPVTCFYVRDPSDQKNLHRAVFVTDRSLNSLTAATRQKLLINNGTTLTFSHLNDSGVRVVLDELGMSSLPCDQALLVELTRDELTDHPDSYNMTSTPIEKSSRTSLMMIKNENENSTTQASSSYSGAPSKSDSLSPIPSSKTSLPQWGSGPSEYESDNRASEEQANVSHTNSDEISNDRDLFVINPGQQQMVRSTEASWFANYSLLFENHSGCISPGRLFTEHALVPWSDAALQLQLSQSLSLGAKHLELDDDHNHGKSLLTWQNSTPSNAQNVSRSSDPAKSSVRKREPVAKQESNDDMPRPARGTKASKEDMLQRNKKAAAKCRASRKVVEAEVKTRMEILRQQHRELGEYVEELQSSVDCLRKLVAEHVDCA